MHFSLFEHLVWWFCQKPELAKNFSQKVLTNQFLYDNIYESLSYGSLAQLGEHLPYKQRVIGSSPIAPISFTI